MHMPSWLKHLPEFVSFVVSIGLSSLAILPSSPKKHHWGRWLTVGFLLLLSVGACIESIHQKRDADAQAASDRKEAAENAKRAAENAKNMQATIDRLAKAQEEDVRDKAAHPIILANYEMIGDEPTVGVPLGMQLKWVLRLSKDTTFINRQGWEIVFIDKDVTAIPNPEREKLEEGVWARMFAKPPLTLPINYTESASGNELFTTPLNENQVNALVNGRALAYFMEEIRDPNTDQVVLSFCHFIYNPGIVQDCFSHNKS